LISTPLVLASEEYAKKAFVRYAEIPALTAPEVSWAQGSAVLVDAARKVATIRDGTTGETYEEAYDYLISSTGLKRSWPAVPQSLNKKQYLEEAGAHIKLMRDAERVVVVGGGMHNTLMSRSHGLTLLRCCRH
jgi:NADPH-dependent 2,4-dienoyl-CoA reductase/sulfur reductase-like enzyme